LTKIGGDSLKSCKTKRSDKNPSGPLTNAPAAPFFKNHKTDNYAHSPSPEEEYAMPKLTKLQRKHNQERVNRVADIIEGYKSRVTGEDAATCLRDVLADLMHFARANRINFEEELATARKHFHDETSGWV